MDAIKLRRYKLEAWEEEEGEGGKGKREKGKGEEVNEGRREDVGGKGEGRGEHREERRREEGWHLLRALPNRRPTSTVPQPLSFLFDALYLSWHLLWSKKKKRIEWRRKGEKRGNCFIKKQK
jgi:hypothetical protein